MSIDTLAELAKIDPAAAQELAEAIAADEAGRIAMLAALEASNRRKQLQRAAESRVMAHIRAESVPPGLDAFELVQAQHEWEMRDHRRVYRAERRENGSVAVQTWEWSQEQRRWWRVHMPADIIISPQGVPKYKRKPRVTPARLAELCGETT